MGRHKTTGKTDEERSELYNKYIEPNHKLVRTTVSRMTSKKIHIKDNFQLICMHMLRYIDTYDPNQKISNWIITVCRREIGKIEGRRDSYTDATKGSENEYVTIHSGYKKKYRPKKAKDFVNIYDDSEFTEDLDSMVYDGVGDDKIKTLRVILPECDFGGGSYNEIMEAISNCEDLGMRVYFMKEVENEKYKYISESLGISMKEVKKHYSRTKEYIENIIGKEL